MKTAQLRKLQKAFTLVELLVVIAILGILAAAVLIAINPAQKINQAKDSKVKSDLGQLTNALQAFYTDAGNLGTASYPNVYLDLQNGETIGANTVPAELKSVPTDPTGTSYGAGSGTNYYKPSSTTGSVTACAAGACTYASLSGPEYNPANGTDTTWCWRSQTGAITTVANAAACLP